MVNASRWWIYQFIFAVDDMQISEDLQLTVGHMVMKWLKKKLAEYCSFALEAFSGVF